MFIMFSCPAMPVGLGVFIHMSNVNDYGISKQCTIKSGGWEIKFNDTFTSLYKASAAC